MRQSRPLLPIRPLELPARLGRRPRRHAPPASTPEVLARLKRSNLAVALAARPVWLRGPLFQSPPSQTPALRHAA